MMKVEYNIKQEGLDVNKRIYECSVCGKLFNWTDISSWYGSDKEMKEYPETIKYFCSDECARNKRIVEMTRK